MNKLVKNLKHIFYEFFGLFYDDLVLASGVIITALVSWSVAKFAEQPQTASIILIAGFFVSLLISLIRQMFKKAKA